MGSSSPIRYSKVGSTSLLKIETKSDNETNNLNAKVGRVATPIFRSASLVALGSLGGVVGAVAIGYIGLVSMISLGAAAFAGALLGTTVGVVYFLAKDNLDKSGLEKKEPIKKLNQEEFTESLPEVPPVNAPNPLEASSVASDFGSAIETKALKEKDQPFLFLENLYWNQGYLDMKSDVKIDGIDYKEITVWPQKHLRISCPINAPCIVISMLFSVHNYAGVVSILGRGEFEKGTSLSYLPFIIKPASGYKNSEFNFSSNVGDLIDSLGETPLHECKIDLKPILARSLFSSEDNKLLNKFSRIVLISSGIREVLDQTKLLTVRNIDFSFEDWTRLKSLFARLEEAVEDKESIINSEQFGDREGFINNIRVSKELLSQIEGPPTNLSH